MTRAFVFLIDTFSSLYLIILILRFWLPIFRANHRNSIAQGVVKFTAPLVTPVRRYVPAIGRLDTATVLIAIIIQFAALAAIAAITGATFTSSFVLHLGLMSLLKLASISTTLFMVAIIVRVILNLLGKYFGAISDLLVDLTEPLLRPIRQVLPALGVLDLSAYVCVVLLIALNMVLADLQFKFS